MIKRPVIMKVNWSIVAAPIERPTNAGRARSAIGIRWMTAAPKKAPIDRPQSADDDDEQELEREIDVERLGLGRAEP